VILTGREIAAQVALGRIHIEPFDDALVTTNSYDLRLGRQYLRYLDPELDVRVPAAYEIADISDDGLHLPAGTFVLAETTQIVGSDYYVPLVHGKSSTARLGLFVHVTADLIDIGSHGQLTLQLYATLPVTVYPGMLLAQVTFWQPKGDIELYRGKYQNSLGPRPSLAHRDFLMPHGHRDDEEQRS
jgi:dCTP deaminase